LNEFHSFLSSKGSNNQHTRKSLLRYYRKQGRITSIKRGLYAVIPTDTQPELFPVDPFLIASKMTPDAVLGYHTALEFYGSAYSVFTKFYYVTSKKTLPLQFQSSEIIGVMQPRTLRDKAKEDFCVKESLRGDFQVRVTNFERTLVDMLDRPELSGSWEEIWRSLELVEYFDLDQVLEYTLLLENSTTAAKVGFFLDKHKDQLMVDNYHLKYLRKYKPGQPHYMTRNKRKGCHLVKEWNLMVPSEIIHQTWKENDETICI
jgi:predicted transcriptional regulator of viral defense system